MGGREHTGGEIQRSPASTPLAGVTTRHDLIDLVADGKDRPARLLWGVLAIAGIFA